MPPSTEGGDFIVERLARYAAPGAAENREVLSIISTAIVQLQFIGNKCIADSLGGSSFQLLLAKREAITCFLIPPGEFLGGKLYEVVPADRRHGREQH